MIDLLGASPLYRKIMLSVTLASVFFLSLLTLIVVFSNEKLEEDLLAKQSDFELDYVRKLLAADPQARLPGSASLSTFLESRRAQQPIPKHLDGLADGLYHDIRMGGKSYHILVAPYHDDRIYIQHDVTDIEKSEDLLTLILLVAWVVLIVIIFFIAMILSKELSRPIRQLSDELTRLNPDERGVRLSQRFAEDEVGRIARAFDDYSQKIDGYVEKQIAFAAMASHELRSPLTIVQTSVDLIRRHHDESVIAPYLEKINRATGGMSNLIHALLAVTRDKPTLNPTVNVSLRPLVGEIIDAVATEAIAKQIWIDNELEYEDCVAADPTLLAVVLSNLIRNSVKHGERSSIVIAMQATQLRISDSGVGIDLDEVQHIFDFGYRSQQSQGYGVGLYISKLVCDHQGWGLSLEHNAEGGTTAKVDFTT